MAKLYIIADYGDVESALINYYGSNVIIYYAKTDTSTGTVVFEIPQISDKVFAVTGPCANCHLGDAWDTGATLINQISFGGTLDTTAAGNDWVMIAASNFLIFSKASFARTNFIGKLTNGEPVCMGLAYIATRVEGKRGYEISTLARIYPAGILGKMLTPDGEMYKMPLYFSTETGHLLANDDGTPAYIEGLYVAGYQPEDINIYTSEFWLSPSVPFMEGRGNVLLNSLFVELTEQSG